LPEGMHWYVSANTDMPAGSDFYPVNNEPELQDQNFILGSRAVIILVGRLPVAAEPAAAPKVKKTRTVKTKTKN